MILTISKKVLILSGLLTSVSALAFTVMNQADKTINIELFCPKADTHLDSEDETCWEADLIEGTAQPHLIDFGLIEVGSGFTVPSFDCELAGDTGAVKKNYFCALGNYTGSLTKWTTTNPLVSDPSCQLDFKWISSKGKGGVATSTECECTAVTCKDNEIDTSVDYGPTIVSPSGQSTFIELFPPSDSSCPRGHEVYGFFSLTAKVSAPVTLRIPSHRYQYICLYISTKGNIQYSNKPILNHQNCKITIETTGTPQYEGCEFQE